MGGFLLLHAKQQAARFASLSQMKTAASTALLLQAAVMAVAAVSGSSAQDDPISVMLHNGVMMPLLGCDQTPYHPAAPTRRHV